MRHNTSRNDHHYSAGHTCVRACVRALHRTCVVPVLHLNKVSRHQIWTLRGLVLKHEADVVLMFPVPPQELKVTTEIMELRISWTSWKLGKSLTTVLWWISIFNQTYLGFFYPFHLNKSHFLVLLHTNDVTLVHLTCFTDLVATLL